MVHSAKQTIIVVDDDPDNQMLFAMKLEHYGFEVFEALSGPAALDLLNSVHPDAILMDRMMPKMDGIEVTKRIRRNEKTKHIPIIMVTAMDSAHHMVQGFEAGVNDYVSKPIDWDILIFRLRSQLRLFEYQQQAARSKEKLEHELRVARKVQQGLLPNAEQLMSLRDSYGVEVSAMWEPSRYLGGDFWDLLSLADGSLGILLTDFAGFGVAPSFHTIRTKTFAHAQCLNLYSPSLTLSRLNTHFLDAFEEDEIATASYAIYHPDNRRLVFSSAGGPSPLVYRAKAKGVQAIRNIGYPLGAFAEASWKETTVDLEVGDLVLFFTDGLLKLESTAGSFVKERQIAEFLMLCGDREIDYIKMELKELIEPYRFVSTNPDDLTLVLFRVVE
ncbi:MAG: PP2C family protein-serine/threonine phosphatase [Sumerlaeia bacterium]